MDAAERTRGLERMRDYVATLRPLLRLLHWEIVVDEAQPGDGALADNCTYMRQWNAEVRFSDRHFADSPVRQRETVVHELLHIVVEPWYRSNLAAFEALGATAQEWARDRHEHEMEMVVDALAKIVAPHLPLPPVEEAIVPGVKLDGTP